MGIFCAETALFVDVPIKGHIRLRYAEFRLCVSGRSVFYGMESRNLFNFGENTMTVSRKNMREFARHLMMVIFVNMVIALLLVDAYFVDTPTEKITAGIRILLAFVAMGLIINEIKRIWKNVRHPGYYFLPTTPVFLILDEQHRRQNAETETARFERIVLTWPDPSIGIISEVLNPERQEESLSKLLYQMGAMRDGRLATITDRYRHYLGEILKSVDDNGHYLSLRQIMLRLSLYGPDKYRQTYRRFLQLLSDVYDPTLSAQFDRQFRKDMTDSLKHAIERADQVHAARIRDIVGKIMEDNENEHEIASSITEMLLRLDWKKKREICRIIFDESMKRAFRFPKHFGIEFLIVLSRLEHRIFWLDIRSLRNILEESLKHEADGLINLNRSIYGELCSRVFAPLEDPASNGICNARVFRRLEDDHGKATIKCILSNGKTCSCQGESLSFRGVYSKHCRRNVGETLSMNVIPIREVESPFAVKASVAPLHNYESATQGPGRGAFFEDAEPSTVKGLYEFVSTSQ